MTGIFISYRRSVGRHLAQLICRELDHRGFDVFLNVTSIGSGEFDRILRNQIAARPHFLLVLSSGSLERCIEEDDWLRQEILEAYRLKRNIVPIYDEDFKINEEKRYLPQPLRTELPRLNAALYSHVYFNAFVDGLCTRFLKLPEYEIVITPTPEAERAEVERRIKEALTFNFGKSRYYDIAPIEDTLAAPDMIIKIRQEEELPSIPASIVEDFLPFEEAVAERIKFFDRTNSPVEKQGAKFDLKVEWGSAYEIENVLIMLWIPERKEWIAICYNKWLESGGRYDEYYSGPYTLNEYAQRKLQQAFGIPKDMNISPSDTTSLPPEILTALGTKSR